MMDKKRSFIPSNLFQSLIQRANDSGSFDTSLEFKSLPAKEKRQRHKQVAPTSPHQNITIAYMSELRERIDQRKKTPRRNENEAMHEKVHSKESKPETPKKIPFLCKKNVQTPTKKSSMPSSSTPMRSTGTMQHLNLLTPPPDVGFIDGDSRHNISTAAVDGDTEDTDQNCRLKKFFSLTPKVCRHLGESFKSERSPTSIPSSPVFERKSTFFSSFRKNRSSVVSPNEESPLKRQKNVKVKRSKMFQFFRSPNASSTTSSNQSDLAQTCSMLNELLSHSAEDETLIGEPEQSSSALSEGLATDDDDPNEEFSFICEPSHSDHSSTNSTSAYESCHSDEPNEIKSRTPTPDTTRRPIDKRRQSTPFRRSISNPMLTISSTEKAIENIVAAQMNRFNQMHIMNQFNWTNSLRVSCFCC